MRKLLLSLIFTLTCLAANGQKNMVAPYFGVSFDTVFYGGYGNGTKYGTLEGLYEPTISNSGGPMLSVEYLRRVTNRINLGTEFHYGASSVTRTPGQAYKDDPETISSHLFALTPNVRFDYIIGAQCRIYVKADAGIGLRTNPEEGTKINFEYQFFPLGIEITSRHLFLFGELGAGTLYYVRFGAGRWF